MDPLVAKTADFIKQQSLQEDLGIGAAIGIGAMGAAPLAVWAADQIGQRMAKQKVPQQEFKPTDAEYHNFGLAVARAEAKRTTSGYGYDHSNILDYHPTKFAYDHLLNLKKNGIMFDPDNQKHVDDIAEIARAGWHQAAIMHAQKNPEWLNKTNDIGGVKLSKRDNIAAGPTTGGLRRAVPNNPAIEDYIALDKAKARDYLTAFKEIHG